MFVEWLVGGAIAYWGAKQYIGRKKTDVVASKSLATILQNTQNNPPEITAPSALNLWNEFATIEEANGHLALTTSSVLLAIGGLTINPLLGMLTIPLIVLSTVKLYQRSWHAWRNERKITVSTLSSFFVLGGLLRGYYIYVSLASLIYSLTCNLLLRIRDESSADLVDIYQQFPHHIWIVDEVGQEIRLPLAMAQKGDRVVVHVGEVIPVDGTIIEGMATVDQQILTGESQPVDRSIGDTVMALTVLLSGKLTILVEKTGTATTAAKIGQTLNSTIDYKANLQLQAEDIADQTSLPTLLLSAVAFPLFGSLGALATLDAHPKFKMSLVAPLGMMNILKLAMSEGCFIKDGRSLDLLDQVDTVIFDKTGTLTAEQPHVGRIHAYNGYDELRVLTLAAAAEAHQTHPIAKAILVEAAHWQLTLPELEEAAYKIGYGLTVQIEEQQVHVGSTRFLEGEGITIPTTVAETVTECHQTGHSIILVAVDCQVVGAIELHASIRPEAKTIIAKLRRRQINAIYVISGDHEAPTKRLAEELGIDRYFAQVLPEKKAQIIQQLQTEGRFVCYVGDGINDAIALKQAQVSISLKGATAVAQDTAHIILLDATLQNLDKVFDFGTMFKRRSRAAFIATFVPAAFATGGVFLLHFGLLQTILLNQVGLIGGLLPALWPLPALPDMSVEHAEPTTKRQQIHPHMDRTYAERRLSRLHFAVSKPESCVSPNGNNSRV